MKKEATGTLAPIFFEIVVISSLGQVLALSFLVFNLNNIPDAALRLGTQPSGWPGRCPSAEPQCRRPAAPAGGDEAVA